MSNLWFAPSKPINIKPIPWLSPDAIKFLESIITPDMEIVEHGSGGSTLWFAKRCKSVVAFEDDPDWQMVVKKNSLKNATIYSSTTTIDLPYGDLLLIDGEPVTDRCIWIKRAKTIVRPGGWIVLDNANRPEYRNERERLKEFADLIYTSPLVCDHLITEFWKVRS